MKNTVNNHKLYGAILGDLVGQPYEFKHGVIPKKFNIHNPISHITDDSLMTLATASYMLGMFSSFEEAYKHIGNEYDQEPFGYGASFKEWLKSPLGTVNKSYGNGCLMRVSPCAYYPKKISVEAAVESTLCSHLHPKSIIAVVKLMDLYHNSIFRASCFKFMPLGHINYAKDKFLIQADDTIKLVEQLFWLTKSTHQTLQITVELGGDTDTNASIVGELMNYTLNDLTKEDVDYVESKLDSYQLNILKKFNNEF